MARVRKQLKGLFAECEYAKNRQWRPRDPGSDRGELKVYWQAFLRDRRA
jgi:hypothetical protein